MGLLGKIFKNKNMSKNYEIPVNKRSMEIMENSFYSLEQGYTTTIFGIEEEGIKARHRNGETTRLMLAKAIKVREGDALLIDSAEDIAFELKENQPINREVLQVVANEYEKQKQLENQICKYLGIVNKTENQYEISQKSLKIADYVQNYVAPKILKQREEKNRIREEKYLQRQKIEERRNNFTQSLDAKDYVSQFQEIKKDRLENPYLRKREEYRIGSRIYENYDGINVNTGDILRIRKLDKVGKDGSGTYLYQGYINSTPNEYDAEIFDKKKPVGIPVCFELSNRISDIERTNEPQEIKKLLELLSSVDKYTDCHKLLYIGGIDKQGNLYRKQQPDSLAIANTVKKLEREFNENNGVGRE